MRSKQARLKSELDKLWSIAVRKKYKRCVMCGSSSNLQAHHCIKRKGQSLGVRWLLLNGVSLCVGCHMYKLHGGQADKAWLSRYIQVLNDLIPENEQLNIIQIGGRVNKFSIQELEDMVKEFKEWNK